MEIDKDKLRKQLTPEQYRVTQEQGTERPFTGKYHDTKTEGVYKCVVCGEVLFSSDTKFESRTGWPSFFEPIKSEAVGETEDRSHFMTRTEVHCSNCNAHLGHVFEDAPSTPSGRRYCINSASLDLQEREDA